MMTQNSNFFTAHRLIKYRITGITMTKTRSNLGALFLTAILCVSLLPTGVAAEDPSTEHFAFGMEYDWTNLNTDMESMTGLPLDEILSDIMQSADEAGIGLVILEELTGVSSMVVDQYEDGTSMFDAVDGTSVEVTNHVTELTVRHGSLQDFAIITDWGDSFAGWELTVSASSESMFNLDAMYIEYRDADNLVHGHDLELTLSADVTNELGLVGHLESEDGDNVLPLDIGVAMSIGYEIVNSESAVVYEEPSTIHQRLSDMNPGEEIEWEAGTESDSNVWWNEYSSWDYTCNWNSTEVYYECENNEWGWNNWWYYCEYYSDIDTYYCTDDFGQDPDWQNALTEDWTHYHEGTTPEGVSNFEWVESHAGSFSTSTTFDFELTGIPVEEFGLPAGDWDVSVSDSVTDAGSFDEDYECEMWMELFDETQMITTDSGDLEVLSGYGSPMPFGMTCHVANLIAYSFLGTDDAANIADLFEDSFSEIAESMGTDTYDDADSDYLYLSADAYSMDEIDVSVNAWDIDYDTNYEIDLVMVDEGGTVIDVHSMTFTNEYYFWDSVYMSANAYGSHCITATLKYADNNTELDSAEVCFSVPKDMDPSDLLVSIGEGFEESTLENALEMFGTNLENRLSDYEGDSAYHDADMRVLWDPATNRAVGFQMLVYDEDVDSWYTMVGPESDEYPEAPILMSFEYFSGQSAIDQEADLDQETTLDTLVDLTQHDVSDLEEAVGEALGEETTNEETTNEEGTEEAEGEEDGLLPFVSPTLTVMVIALAGIVASMRSREEE